MGYTIGGYSECFHYAYLIIHASEMLVCGQASEAPVVGHVMVAVWGKQLTVISSNRDCL